MIELRGYIDESGNKHFDQGLDALDVAAAAKITIALARLEGKDRFRPRLPHLLWKGWKPSGDSDWRRNEKAAITGYCIGPGLLGS